MNTAAIKRLLTILSSKVGVDRTRLYQLVDLAEWCYYLKDVNGQRDLGLLLQEFQPPFSLVGDYYESIYLNHIGLSDEARKKLERVYELGPEKYRAKALISLGAVEEKRGNFDESMKFRLQAASFDVPRITLEANFGISVLFGVQGEHQHAVKHLEKFLPLARMTAKNTPLYYDYLNSFAVELNDTGRTGEARNVINLVLSTPYVPHYLNWIHTGKEVYKNSYRSSMVSAPKVRFEKPDQEPEPENETPPARVVPFPKLKKAPEPEKPDFINLQELDGMTLAEKREFILKAVRTELLQENEYNKFIFMLGLVKGCPASRIIDLEDRSVLDDLIVEWAHLIEPEQLVGVLSALRDCEDNERRNEIIDNMISKVFEYSRTHNITESEWRLMYERRLPKKSD
jgi:hypothetical protein